MNSRTTFYSKGQKASRFHFLQVFQVFIWMIIFTGCKAIKVPVRNDIAKMPKNLSTLNGIYRNLPTDTSDQTASAWGLFTLDYKKSAFTSYHPNASIELKVENKRKIRVNLLGDSGIIASKVLKGTQRGEFFSVRRKIFYRGLTFIYVREMDYKFQLGKDLQNRLVADGINSRFGWLVFMAAGEAEHYNFVFEPGKPFMK
jgi:hypothetical protein